jgi:hypothetical protein
MWGRRCCFNFGKKFLEKGILAPRELVSLQVYLYGWITGILLKKGTDMVMVVLGNTNMMMFFRRYAHHFALIWLFPVDFCANMTQTSFATFYSSQLLDEQLLVSALVSCLRRAMLEFTLQKYTSMPNVCKR